LSERGGLILDDDLTRASTIVLAVNALRLCMEFVLGSLSPTAFSVFRLEDLKRGVFDKAFAGVLFTRDGVERSVIPFPTIILDVL